MALDTGRLVTDIRACSQNVAEPQPGACGYTIEVHLSPDQVQECARSMYDHGMYLVFITAVHVSPVPEVLYQFAHFDTPCRVLVRTSVQSDGKLPSIAPVYRGADWHEREIHDFYGIVFEGHPHLKPLIFAREDRKMRPLLKRDELVKERSALWPDETGLTAPESDDAGR